MQSDANMVKEAISHDLLDALPSNNRDMTGATEHIMMS